MTRFLALITLALATVASAQNADWERILLPIDPAVVVQGVGTTYKSYVVAHAPEARDYFPRPQNAPKIVYAPFNSAHLVTLPNTSGAATSGGRFLYVERGDGELSVDEFLSVEREGNPFPRVFGVPVARESDFRTGRTVFGYVPIRYSITGELFRVAHAQHRVRLRVFDVDGRGDGAVRLKLYFNGLAHSPITLPLASRAGSDASYPFYGELPIDTCVPFSGHTPCLGGQMVFEIEPATPGLRYWALLTLTDNFTGDVTLIAP